MISQKRIPYINLLLIILTNLVPTITCQYNCTNTGNYTSNSTYMTNLDNLLSSLPAAVGDNGFVNLSVGQGSSDVVNAIALCRGDVLLDRCRVCVRNTMVDLLQFCPFYKQAYLWREGCMVRYSDESIFGYLATGPAFWAWNWVNATSVEQFKSDVRELLDGLIIKAASGGSWKKVAAGNKTGPDSQNIYALVQCTPDITAVDCSTCLNGAAGDLPNCCDWRRAGGIFRPSCNLHYDSAPFYNQTMFQEAQSPSPSPSSLQPGKSDDNSTQNVTVFVLPIVGLVILMLVAGIVIFVRKRMKQKQLKDDEYRAITSLQYDFNKIRDATDNFSESNLLGQGGFGPVYKGKLADDQEIAVKRMSKESEQGDVEFKNEVYLMARLQHRNLVKLLGFCLKESERLLVYEFVKNASLDHFISDPTRRECLDWDTRYKIITGIAKGILYLHEDSRLRIIHRDLKTANVLLDGEMKPKIADFGLARLVAQDDQTHESTRRIVGTYGYMPPEYAFQGHFSIKSDVFSFGVILLEIVSGQKNNNFQNSEQNFEHLLSYAWRIWQEGRAENVIDPLLRTSPGFPGDILRCIHIGLLCVQENAADRPTMTSVVLMLNSSSLNLTMPSKPAFFVHGGVGHVVEIPGEMNQSPNYISENEASFTELHPR